MMAVRGKGESLCNLAVLSGKSDVEFLQQFLVECLNLSSLSSDVFPHTVDVIEELAEGRLQGIGPTHTLVGMRVDHNPDALL